MMEVCEGYEVKMRLKKRITMIQSTTAIVRKKVFDLTVNLYPFSFHHPLEMLVRKEDHKRLKSSLAQSQHQNTAIASASRYALEL